MKTLLTLLALLLTQLTCASRIVALSWLISFFVFPFNAFASSAMNFRNLGVTATTKVVAWSGYHDSTCTWSRTNTTIGDFTADATCNLVQTVNNGFGTVSAGGSVLPEIVFTPDHSGTYFVCADVGVNGTAGGTMKLILVDGNGTSIDEQGWSQVSTDVNRHHMICGLWNAPSTSSQTIKLQGASSGTIGLGQAITSIRSVIEWTIYAIGNDASGVRTFGFVYGGATEPNTCGTNTTCTIWRQWDNFGNTDIVTSVVNGATTGRGTVTLKSGACSSPPVCSIVSYGTTNAICRLDSGITGTSTFTVQGAATTTGSAAAVACSATCICPK